MSKVQHMTGRKTGFFRFFNFSTNITTGNRKNSEFVQPQPVVRSFAVGFSPISVFFPVQRTGPANTRGGHWMSLPIIQEGTRRRQFINGGDRSLREETVFIEEGDSSSSSEIICWWDASYWGRTPVIQGEDHSLREEIHWGRKSFIKRGGHSLK